MKKPFTLVEVLVAMSVLSVFLLGLMQFYSSTENVLSSGVAQTEMFERARIAMDMMANDLTCIYYSQSDDDLTPFRSSGDSDETGYFEAVTVRPEKLNSRAKTTIVAVKYQMKDNTLYYSYDPSGDNFGLEGAAPGNETELVEGVSKFSISSIYGDGFNLLPAIVIIRLELIDGKSLRRIRANPSVKDAILDNPANKREFRRMVVIDRGQPKP